MSVRVAVEARTVPTVRTVVEAVMSVRVSPRARCSEESAEHERLQVALVYGSEGSGGQAPLKSVDEASRGPVEKKRAYDCVTL